MTNEKWGNITTLCFFLSVSPDDIIDGNLTESCNRTKIAHMDGKPAERLLEYMYEVHMRQGNRTKPEDFNCVEVLLTELELGELFDLGVLPNNVVDSVKNTVNEGKRIIFDSWWV